MEHQQDTFAKDRLPKKEWMPQFIFPNKDFLFEGPLNCTHHFIDVHLKNGCGHAIALRTFHHQWTYQELDEKINQIAHILLDDMKMQAGNRVLIRSSNNPLFVACWMAVVKAGGIVVATMPMLREKELSVIIDKAQISIALCDERLQEDLLAVQSPFLKSISFFDGLLGGLSELELKMKTKAKTFEAYPTQADDIALIAFTSGTTGNPKMTAHYQRDLLLICKGYPTSCLQPKPSDIFTGSPPIAFTFGLGGLVLFPLYYGASSFLIESPSPENLLKAIDEHKVSICFTAPTAWRTITSKVKDYDISSLRKCISAGEPLAKPIWEAWYAATGIKILDGIGSTEMLHIFISANEENLRVGATGKPVYGYEAKVIDEQGKECEQGRLAVRGITGCRYLDDERQKKYVVDGWNITGDIYRKDEEGYFHFIARNDDMIISAGYNIGAPEVESVLLTHPSVNQCAVIGMPDEERGHIVCAFIVLKDQSKANAAQAKEIQDWFKTVAAPYKYPRKIVFLDELPRNASGKITKFKLKEKC